MNKDELQFDPAHFDGLKRMAEIVHDINVLNGYYDRHKSVDRMCMLAMSEWQEAHEAYRKDRPKADLKGFQEALERISPDVTTDLGKLKYMQLYEEYLKDRMITEMIGALVRTLDTLEYYKVDIPAMIRYELFYNKCRPLKKGTIQKF